jgi:hypothetical protein
MGELYINDGAGGFERASIPRVGPAPQDTAAWQTLPAAIDLSGNGQISVIAARPGVLGIFSPGAAPVAPQIASISFSPPKATFGHQITILANGVSVQGSTVSSVRFYRDSNGNGVRDARDQFLGADTSSRGGWSLSTRVSSSWGAGYTTVFAVATDALGRRGETFASVQSVPQTPPTIGDLSITQYTGWWSMYRLGPMAVLKAIDVADVDGPVKEVSFYRDVNFNNRVDSADQFLGSAREGAGFQIKVRLKTNWWVNLGTQIKFVARARDQDNQIGTAVSLLVTR